MKVAISSTGRPLDSEVDRRFGRAAFFVVVDSKTMEYEALDNANAAAAGGAGIGSAKTVVDSGAEAVLTGNCGPNAERVLRAAGVKLYTGVTGTVVSVSNIPAGLGGTQSTYYKDDSAIESDDTGDQRSYGDTGLQVDDRVIVHAGFVIERLDPEEADKIDELWDQYEQYLDEEGS